MLGHVTLANKIFQLSVQFLIGLRSSNATHSKHLPSHLFFGRGIVLALAADNFHLPFLGLRACTLFRTSGRNPPAGTLPQEPSRAYALALFSALFRILNYLLLPSHIFLCSPAPSFHRLYSCVPNSFFACAYIYISLSISLSLFPSLSFSLTSLSFALSSCSPL